MIFFPAIDVLEGAVVRLRQGDYNQVTRYGDSTADVAQGYLGAGASWIHVVDLEGARSGKPCAVAAIESAMAAAPGIRFQVGGGIRNDASVEAWLDAGVHRVVLGTAAVANPEWVAGLCTKYPKRIVVAVDSRGDQVSVDGWTRDSGVRVDQLVESAGQWGAAAALYTQVHVDGTGEGPDVEGTLRLQALAGNMDVIASGGVGSLDDIRRLQQAGARAVVCGRALYDGAFSVEQALACANPETA